MDAVVDLGALALSMQPRRADGEPVRERRVEGVESGQTSSAYDDRTTVFARDAALLELVTGSKLQYDQLLEMTAQHAEPAAEQSDAEPDAGHVDLYA